MINAVIYDGVISFICFPKVYLSALPVYHVLRYKPMMPVDIDVRNM